MPRFGSQIWPFSIFVGMVVLLIVALDVDLRLADDVVGDGYLATDLEPHGPGAFARPGNDHLDRSHWINASLVECSRCLLDGGLALVVGLDLITEFLEALNLVIHIERLHDQSSTG